MVERVVEAMAARPAPPVQDTPLLRALMDRVGGAYGNYLNWVRGIVGPSAIDQMAATSRLLNRGDGGPVATLPQEAADTAGMLDFTSPIGAMGVPLIAAIFAGRAAKNAPLGALSIAEKLASEGVDARAIWRDTGWFRGPDGQWRWEIDDSGARVAGNLPAEHEGILGDIINHQRLYDAYPDMPGMHATFGQTPGESGAYGPVKGVTEESIAIGPAAPRRTALHEMQHAVQNREGFARGGSPYDKSLSPLARDVAQKAANDYANIQNEMRAFQDKFLIENGIPLNDMDYTSWMQRAASEWRKQNPDLARRYEQSFVDMEARGPRSVYPRLAGEAEARAVQARAGMTPEQRRAAFPLDSYDVPVDQLIVRGGR